MITACASKYLDHYLNKLIKFQDTENIKVVTGIRCCGKSSLLKRMITHLREHGTAEHQIIEINPAFCALNRITDKDVFAYIKERIAPQKRMYLFFYEVQCIPDWENLMDSLRTDFDCDIYITGSNIGLHTREYSAGTGISSNFVEVELFPLSFCEFLYFHDFEMKEEKDSLGGIRRQISDKRGKSYGVREVFDAYMKFGGIPSIADICWDQEKALVLLEDACSSVIVYDILEREDRGWITDFALLREIMLLLAGNIGSSISISSISNTLAKKEFLKHRRRKGSPSIRMIQRFINALIESNFFYNVKCYDIKKNRYLHTLGKFYIADIGLRNGLLGYQDCEKGAVLKNIVYFELLRRDYTVSTGKIDQVMETMTKESISRDKLTPLMKISGNCKKMILSLESDLCFNYEGIQFANLMDWLID